MTKQHAIFIAEKSYIVKNVKPIYERIKARLPYTIDAFYALAGHIMQLTSPDDKKSFDWKNVPYLPNNIMTFDWDTIAPTNKQKLFKPSTKKMGGQTGGQRARAIQKFINTHHVDFVISAGDSDREGTCLAREPFIWMGWPIAKTKRFWLKGGFTTKAITNALENLLDMDYTFSDGQNVKHMHQAAMEREFLDRIWGYSLSPAITLKTGKLTRAGRVKLPTMKLVVDRDLEIANFKPKDYYTITQDFVDKGQTYTGNLLEKGKKTAAEIRDKDKAQQIANALAQSKQGKIIDVKQTKQAVKAPQLLRTNDVLTHFLHKYNSKKIQDELEFCYRHSYITYPRTDSRYLSTSNVKNFPAMLAGAASVPSLKAYAASINKTAINKMAKSKRYIDSTKAGAHGALVPTDTKFDFKKLNKIEQELVTYIDGYFIQAFMPAQQLLKTDITTQNAGYNFITKGKVEQNPGWTKVLGKSSSNTVLPPVAKNDIVDAKTPKTLAKQTKPKPHYTASTLVHAMGNIYTLITGTDAKSEKLRKKLKEAHGCGTDTSQLAIIRGLIQSKQFLLKGKKILASPETIKLVKALHGMTMLDPIFTAQFEQNLSNVSKGKLSPEKYLQDTANYITEECKRIKNSKTIPLLGTVRKPAQETDMTYNNAPVKIGTSKYGKYYQVQLTPKKHGFINCNIGGVEITPELLKKLLAGETLKDLTLKSKYGKDYKASLKFNTKTGKVDHIFADKKGNTTDEKKIGEVRKKPVYLRKGKWGPYYELNSGKARYFLSKKWSSHQWSSDEALALLGGKSVSVTFKTRYGKTMQSRVKYDKRKKKIVFAD